MADNFTCDAVSETEEMMSETTDSVNMKDEKLADVSEIQEFVKKDVLLVDDKKLNVGISEFGFTYLPKVTEISLADDDDSIKKDTFLNLENNLVAFSENSKIIQENHLPNVKDNGILNGGKGKILNVEDKCRLKIEVIDDTAMIDISQLGKTTTKKKRIYSRKELEDMRYIGMEQQKTKWVQVYCGLSDVVRKEYDSLLHHFNNKQKPPRRHRGKENTPNVISGDLVAKERGKHLKVYSQRSMTYGNLQRTLWLPVH